MQADEIDQIMAGILRDVGAYAKHHTHAEIAYLIRSALRSAGLTIQLDEAALLAKGNEAVKLHE